MFFYQSNLTHVRKRKEEEKNKLELKLIRERKRDRERAREREKVRESKRKVSPLHLGVTILYQHHSEKLTGNLTSLQPCK